MEYIQGEKFYDIADFIYSPDIKTKFDDYNKLNNTFNLLKLNPVNIIYTHTLYVKYLFDVIGNLSNNIKFIIITHNSDLNIDDSYEIPNNVVKWFAQNVNTYNDKIQSIPIGLENSKWHPQLNKLNKIKNKVNEQKQIKNLLYVNHSIRTNPKEREKPYQLFAGKNWVNLEYGKNGVNFDSYLNNINNHNFVLCPDGNGIDTHRLWECLYLNTIPIVKRGVNVSYYKELPILIVDDWEEIREDYLLYHYQRIKNTKYDLNMLDLNYWINNIKKEKDKYEQSV